MRKEHLGGQASFSKGVKVGEQRARGQWNPNTAEGASTCRRLHDGCVRLEMRPGGPIEGPGGGREDRPYRSLVPTELLMPWAGTDKLAPGSRAQV